MSMSHEPLRYAHDEGHTDVCYTENGESFITCGADGDIRIWSTDDSQDPVHNCIGEWALSVRQKNDKIYVATGSNDIQILTLPEGERDGVLDRFTAPINQIAINKTGNIIALAGEDMQVKLITINEESKDVKVIEGLLGPCLSIAISCDSKLVASSCGDGTLRIWNLENLEEVHKIDCVPKANSFANASNLCRMDFHPKSPNILAYPNNDTIILLDTKTFEEKSTLYFAEIDSPYSILQFSPCGKYILGTTESGHFVLFDVATKSVTNNSEHEKSVAICGLMWNPKGNGQVVYTDVEGQLGIINNCTPTVETTENIENEGNEMLDDLNNDDEIHFEDDNDDDNENAVSLEKLKQQYNPDLEADIQFSDKASSRSPTPRARTPELPLQPSFMPSSTPDHLDPRYLCWNEVGVIRCYGLNTEDELSSKSIEVEFHDSTFHNSLMIQNYQSYTMGSISKGALVVANSKQINVIPLGASKKEWNLNIEEFEEIVCVASSENLVCLGLSTYLVRVCSIYGTQRAVVSIPGPIISMSAFSNVLMVAYHTGGTRKGDQCINIKLIQFSGTKLESRDIGSALGPESTLTWLGFSDIGTPAMFDSLGVLCMFPPANNIWIPVCDTTKHRVSPADGFFVTAIFESYQAVGGIKCKGSNYPGFTPRPTMCELPLNPPFAESSTEKTNMESNLFLWSNIQVDDSTRKYRETALKIFALACKNDLEERALEFIEILNNPQIVDLGSKYAVKLNKRRLAEKLMTLATNMMESADFEEENVEKVVVAPEPREIRPVHRKLSLKGTPRNRTVQNVEKTPLSQSQNNLNNTPALNGTSISTQDTTINTQESIIIGSVEKPKNPFLKKTAKEKTSNPLSLTDANAGITVSEKNSEKNIDTTEKRKLSDSDGEKPKGKQRKLDMFRFKKV